MSLVGCMLLLKIILNASALAASYIASALAASYIYSASYILLSKTYLRSECEDKIDFDSNVLIVILFLSTML